MKKTALMTLVCVSLSVSVPAAAADDWKEVCTGFSEIAQSVMKARQDGAAMSALMKLGDGNNAFENMVIAAFDKPRYSTAPVRRRTIEEFRDDMFARCAKDMRR